MKFSYSYAHLNAEYAHLNMQNKSNSQTQRTQLDACWFSASQLFVVMKLVTVTE